MFMKKAERAPWVKNGEEFPKVVRNGPLYDLTNEPEYKAAKAGIVPVFAVESKGNNKIPLAIAQVISSELDFTVEDNIGQNEKVSRGGSNANHRLVFNPTFSGEVKKGQDYFIVDDTLTQGGTISSLRGYIENRGGNVLGAMVMASKEYSLQIAVSDMADQAIQKHGQDIDIFLKKELGYGIQELTYSEARTIRDAKDIDEIRVRFDDARHERVVGMDEKRITESEGREEKIDNSRHVEEHAGNVDLPDLRNVFATFNKLRNQMSESKREEFPKQEKQSDTTPGNKITDQKIKNRSR